MSQQRRRRSKRAVDWQDARWEDKPQWKDSLQDWRSTSPTMRLMKENADRFRVSIEAVKRGLHHARYSAVSTSKDAKLRFIQYLKAINSLHRGKGSLASEKVVLDRSEEVVGDLQRIVRELGTKRDSQSFAAGTLLFGGLMFLAGSQPWALPWVYLLFICISLPLRTIDFVQRKWTFFLLDFCYMAVHALADGPLAAALIVWQSAWVFGSAAHSISVLIHQLPGLALFALRHCSPPPQLDSYLPTRVEDDTAFQFSFLWCFVVPLVFYMCWQLLYFLIVQVVFRQFIISNGYDTSYKCLARRAVKSNNFWNRTVRKGSIKRRVFMFGFIQALYTIGVLLLFIPIYHSFYLSFLWQVVKIVFPIWYGSRYICEKQPRAALLKILKQESQA